MTERSTNDDGEFTAMHAIYKALEPLDDDARSRVISYICARLDIAATPIRGGTDGDGADDEPDEAALEGEEAKAPKFAAFAELFDTAGSPSSNADRALLAGYWLQVCNDAEAFDGFSANKELKHLGQGIANITDAINALKAQKPALALQLKKSGKSRQARKTYKLTVAGIKAVENMING